MLSGALGKQVHVLVIQDRRVGAARGEGCGQTRRLETVLIEGREIELRLAPMRRSCVPDDLLPMPKPC